NRSRKDTTMSKSTNPKKAFQNTVKDALTKAACQIDQVICRKNGSVEVKRSYFYPFGMTAEKYAEQISEPLAHEGILATVHGEDRWAAWPKTSYFVVIIYPKD